MGLYALLGGLPGVAFWSLAHRALRPRRAGFGVQFSPPVATGRFITATATDSAGNTCKFSNALQVLAPRNIVTNTLDSGAVASVSLQDAINFANGNPATTISFAIQPSRPPSNVRQHRVHDRSAEPAAHHHS